MFMISKSNYYEVSYNYPEISYSLRCGDFSGEEEQLLLNLAKSYLNKANYADAKALYTFFKEFDADFIRNDGEGFGLAAICKEVVRNLA